MQLESFYHRPKLNWCFAYDNETVIVRLRTKIGDVDSVTISWGDKYVWDETLTHDEMDHMGADAFFDYWEAAVKPPYRRLAYLFEMKKGKTTVFATERGFDTFEKIPEGMIPSGMFEYPFLNPVDVIKPPAWVKDAVFYQIFPERFANGDPSLNPPGTETWGHKPTCTNFFGGDIQGIIDHLDYLVELGITAIYFCPMFAADTNHKYDTKDYMKVDPQFGTNEKLKELVDLCHAKGLKVLLDAVFNHSGASFPPFLDVKQHGEQSKYKDWFHVRSFPLRVENGKPTYDTFSFEAHMPKLNTENPELKAYLLEVARYWVEDIGIDGWRLDVANEVDHQFWRDFRRVVKQANPEAYILGELWHDPIMWLQGDQFDAVMNYPFFQALTDYFVHKQIDADLFAVKIMSLLVNIPKQVNEVTFNLVDSHDTARLLTQCKGNKDLFKLTVAFQFTFLGAPCIYYGDEIGMHGGEDPDCRQCMIWENDKHDQDIFRFYQQLIRMRKQYQVLKTGSFKFLYVKEGDPRIAYERKDEHEHMIIFMNNHKRLRKMKLEVPAGDWENVLTGERYSTTKNQLQVELGGYGYLILRKI